VEHEVLDIRHLIRQGRERLERAVDRIEFGCLRADRWRLENDGSKETCGDLIKGSQAHGVASA
jgi:hypothetical protein